MRYPMKLGSGNPGQNTLNYSVNTENRVIEVLFLLKFVHKTQSQSTNKQTISAVHFYLLSFVKNIYHNSVYFLLIVARFHLFLHANKAIHTNTKALVQ